MSKREDSCWKQTSKLNRFTMGFYLQAADELGYSKETHQKLIQAKTVCEAERIMSSARHNNEGRYV